MTHGRIGLVGGALIALLAGPVSAQSGRYGAVPDVRLDPAAGGWGDGGWGAPDRGPAVDRRVPPPERRPWRDDRDPAGNPGRYVRPVRGAILPPYFAAPPFTVRDFPRWDLAPPGPGRRWVRYYDDAVLVGQGGRIDDVRFGLDWDRDGDGRPVRNGRGRERQPRDPAYEAGYADGYDDGRGDAVDWSDDAVTYGGRDGPAPGQVVTRTTPGTITTVTTVTEDVVTPRPRTPARRKTWRATRR